MARWKRCNAKRDGFEGEKNVETLGKLFPRWPPPACRNERQMSERPQPAETPVPPIMNADDLITYLRLDAKQGDAHERLRNLIRRQKLPVIKRGKLQLFRRASVDAWLAAGERGAKSNAPAR